MTVRGHVKNGVVVVDDGIPLPEGCEVTIEILPRQEGESLYGLWADAPTGITEEDIAAARREMWGNFPRDDI